MLIRGDLVSASSFLHGKETYSTSFLDKLPNQSTPDRLLDYYFCLDLVMLIPEKHIS